MTMLRSMTPSTETAWPYARQDGAGAASATRSGWSRIVAGLRAYRAALAERRRWRRAREELERLDDRMLRDIGVGRSGIGYVVRYGRRSN
jgi:uncharacterized protein YjiS (DUF1127 family)